MTEPSGDLELQLGDEMRRLERLVEGFRPVRIRREGERLCMVFRWFDDPNTYEICSATAGGSCSWEDLDAIDLMEELDTGFLMRAIKTRSGAVLRADLDGDRMRGDPRRGFYLSDVLDYVGHLAADGLDTRPGLTARRARTLLDWSAAYTNTRTGGPALGQLVVVRDSEQEAQIAHLELTAQAGDVIGHELVFSAIHHAARHGIHRLYSPRTLAHVGPFGFASAAERPEALVYDITVRDMNWPQQLSSAADIPG